MSRRGVVAGAACLLALPAAGVAATKAASNPSSDNHRSITMANEPTDARKAFGDIAPKLADISDKVLFGDVWRDPALSPRDRSLVTITSLVALYRHNELEGHIKRGLDNGLTEKEIVAAITHIAFYAGWPPAMTGLQGLRNVLKER